MTQNKFEIYFAQNIQKTGYLLESKEINLL